MDKDVYDLIIVGAGCIGSAAARYASQCVGVKVCVIDPGEPLSRSMEDSRDIYGAHYDEARITGTGAQHDTVWARLAARSIAEYSNLEKLSGIDFYEQVGALYIFTEEGQIVADCLDNTASAGHSVETLSVDQLHSRFPYVHLNTGEQALYEDRAGHINPRKIIKAELKVASNNNCDIIRAIVSKIKYPSSTHGAITLHTDLGNVLYAGKVLLCPGAFVELRQLLPGGLLPDMKLLTQSVIFAEVSEEDMTRMRRMPIMEREIETAVNAEHDCYVLPPVKYPDGKFYIKLGHGTEFDDVLPTSKAKHWYCHDVPKHIKQKMIQTLNNLFPDFQPVNIRTDTCIATRTPNQRVFVDLLSPHVGVAFGGNGYGAASCDHIGKLAAGLILTEKWTSDLPRDWFKFQSVASKL